MTEETGYKRFFDYSLAELLAEKIAAVDPAFPRDAFLAEVAGSGIADLELLARVDVHARALRTHLPEPYPEALGRLVAIYGPENPQETGMFTFGYWLWPVASFIARYGLEHRAISLDAIEELTRRHTGEHAIRPYLEQEPEATAARMLTWARSDNVHVRRLASEGIRPRLPWSKKLSHFLDEPDPVFLILDELKDDGSRFVQKSVGNNINDYLKDNRPAAMGLLERWAADATPGRRWVIRHALRNELKREADDARALVNAIEG